MRVGGGGFHAEIRQHPENAKNALTPSMRLLFTELLELLRRKIMSDCQIPDLRVQIAQPLLINVTSLLTPHPKRLFHQSLTRMHLWEELQAVFDTLLFFAA